MSYTGIQTEFVNTEFVNKFVHATVGNYKEWLRVVEYTDKKTVYEELVVELASNIIKEGDNTKIFHAQSFYDLELSNSKATCALKFEPSWGSSISLKISLKSCEPILKTLLGAIRYDSTEVNAGISRKLSQFIRSADYTIHLIIVPTFGEDYPKHLSNINRLRDKFGGIWALVYNQGVLAAGVQRIFDIEEITLLNIEQIKAQKCKVDFALIPY